MKKKQPITPEQMTREQRRALSQAEKNLRQREAAKKKKASRSIFDDIEKDAAYCLDDWHTARRVPFFGKFRRDDEEGDK